MMLRDYQQKAIDDLYAWFSAGNDGNPCLVLPTGAGKSHIIAALVKDALQNWPETRILMLTHVKELIEQNAEKMRVHWPNAPMGIYSASLGRRCLTEPITFAGIQSVHRRGNEIGHVDLVIVDEAHSINHSQTGGYRTLIADLQRINPNLRVIGLTATPFRLGHGYIHDGEDVLFNALIEPISIEELIYRGFLTKLRSKHTSLTLDTAGVKKQGGDFIASQLEAAVDTSENNRSVVDEIILRGQDRKAWLVFCAGVSHANHIAELLREKGVSCECVTGDTPKPERERILEDYKSGRVRCLTNVNVLSTGFDYPGIDLLAFLRPTMSPGLYMQMAGRGLRIAEGKKDCLVLDFAGNVARHGPIVAVVPPERSRTESEAPTKKCPVCSEIVATAVRVCECCGYQWPEPPPKEHDLRLGNDDIMGLEPSEMLVTGWQWRKHISRTSGKEMLSCTFYGSLSDPPVTEYLPVMHDGFAGDKSRRLLAEIAYRAELEAVPDSDLSEVAAYMNSGQAPSMLKYKRDGKFFRVIERVWYA